MKKGIYFILLVFCSLKANAWSSKGHAIVAQVAFTYLDDATQKNVMSYLDGMTIEEAANWMDNIKDDRSYDYMKPWHYANFAEGKAAEIFEGANIMYQLHQTLKALKDKDKLSKAEIKLKILYLFHLIGDLHQPLHVGYGRDKGGNTVQLNYKGKGTNLHSFWDSGIIYYQSISLPDCLIAQTYSATEVKDLQKIDLVAWGNDSRNLLGAVYDYKQAKVSDDYVSQSGVLIEKQIQKAGIRLAGVLETLFK